MSLVRVGVVSDTHGTLPDSVPQVFRGVDAIVHAGDVGGGRVLEVLRSIAPVTAVRGNMDHSGEASLLPEVAQIELGGVRFLLGHKKADLLPSVDSLDAGVLVVVSGHTHMAQIDEDGRVLYVNPGSGGVPSGGRRATAALVEIADGGAKARIVGL